MDTYLRATTEHIYCPAIPIISVTAQHTLGRLPIVRIEQPELICGIAKRVGYTGKEKTALTLYRLKLKTERGRMEITLPSLYVVDEGIFIDYQSWLAQQQPKDEGEKTHRHMDHV